MSPARAAAHAAAASHAASDSGAGSTTAADADLAAVDVIDLLAGLDVDHPVALLRGHRAQARREAQRSFEALLEPEHPGAFSYAERYAIAAFTARLHGLERAAEFYADLLGDAAPELVGPVLAAAAESAVAGPYGAYREPGLAAESRPGPVWRADPAALGRRLAAALSHAHLLVLRPREAHPDDLRRLVAAGWSADEIVSLSQAVSFLAFQLRVAHGLAVLAGTGAAAAALGAISAPVAGGAGLAAEPGSAGDPGPAAGGAAEGLVLEHPALARPEGFTQEGLGWVPWLAPVAEHELSDEQREALIEPTRAKMPYFRLLARDPAALRARTLTDRDLFFNVADGIGRAERELAAAATSRSTGCVYCAHVHAAAASRESGRRDDVQRLLDEGVGAELGDARWNAIATASAALATVPPAFGDAHLRELRAAGLDELEIIDVIGAAAFFNWANRLMLSLGEPEVPARRR